MIPTLLVLGVAGGVLVPRREHVVAAVVLGSLVWGAALTHWADADGWNGFVGATVLGLVNLGLGAWAGRGLRALVRLRRAPAAT